MQKTQYIAMLLATLLAGCELKFDEFKPSSGQADFTTYVAVGDSYTAGYTDGALGCRGQEVSFPNIIAGQLAASGNSGFTQPMVKSLGSVGSAGNGYYELKMVENEATGAKALVPTPSAGDMTIFAEKVYDAASPAHNLGVPGAKSSHLLYPEYAGANPFYSRFARSTSTSVVSDAVAMNPTFVSLWIGGNDVLTYALAGGEADAITDPNMFAAYMSTIASELFSGNTKGAVANVPSIDALPYFNYIAYNALVIDQTTADLLNAGYAQYNAISEQYGFDKIEFVAGANAFVIEDRDVAHPAKMRQVKKGEKILLGASSGITNPQIGWGSRVALGAEYVLDADEVAAIQTATEKYNETVKKICEEYTLAHVDLNGLMEELSINGLLIDGVAYSASFVSGGVFSLDGIHATARGSAIIANKFIESINTQYKAHVAQVNINDYSAVVYP